ncbi:hypothetical protein Dimus_025896 [Dionaea muscipula]
METISLDLPLYPPTPTQDFSTPATTTIPPAAACANVASSSGLFQSSHYSHQSPRYRMTQIGISSPGSRQGLSSPYKPKPKKPDPSAPKITRPCSECGKKFWSWKALFGHMRCHPERQWRGINPPPQFTHKASPTQNRTAGFTAFMTEEDHEVAACLLLLANSGSVSANPVLSRPCELVIGSDEEGTLDCPDNTASKMLMITDGGGGNGHDDVVNGTGSPPSLGCQFECSSCKKTFGSRQALGGHRASHKNVKGCFAITKSEMMPIVTERGRGGDRGGGGGGTVESTTVVLGCHGCSIDQRVFSGEHPLPLGGHMRCHQEKRVEEPILAIPRVGAGSGSGPGSGSFLDLNLPALLKDGLPCCCSSGLQLDLKLGI